MTTTTRRRLILDNNLAEAAALTVGLALGFAGLNLSIGEDLRYLALAGLALVGILAACSLLRLIVKMDHPNLVILKESGRMGDVFSLYFTPLFGVFVIVLTFSIPLFRDHNGIALVLVIPVVILRAIRIVWANRLIGASLKREVERAPGR